MTMTSPPRIALTGFAGSGKDEVGKILQEFGYERRAPGDIIKRQVDDLCREEMGISAFTENRKDKEKIRPLLETWGEVNYDNVQDEFFASLPKQCVNTRLVRWPEGQRWKDEGGVIYCVERDGCLAATGWEAQQYGDLRDYYLIDGYIRNDGTLAALRSTVISVFNLS